MACCGYYLRNAREKVFLPRAAIAGRPDEGVYVFFLFCFKITKFEFPILARSVHAAFMVVFPPGLYYMCRRSGIENDMEKKKTTGRVSDSFVVERPNASLVLSFVRRAGEEEPKFERSSLRIFRGETCLRSGYFRRLG